MNDDVRRVIAKHPSLGEELIKKLAKDKDPDVRITIAERTVLNDC